MKLVESSQIKLIPQIQFNQASNQFLYQSINESINIRRLVINYAYFYIENMCNKHPGPGFEKLLSLWRMQEGSMNVGGRWSGLEMPEQCNG